MITYDYDIENGNTVVRDLLKDCQYKGTDYYIDNILRFIREKYNIVINIYPEYSKAYGIFEYRAVFYHMNIDTVERKLIKNVWCERYEDALILVVEKVLEYIKKYNL